MGLCCGQIGSLCMNIVEHELKKYDMWQEELQKKRKQHEADKNNSQLKKAYDKSLKQFNSLVRKQEQLLRGDNSQLFIAMHRSKYT